MEYDIESILEKYEDDYNPGPRPMNQGPRNMAQGGRIGFKDGTPVKFDESRVKIPTGNFVGEGRDKSQIFKIKNNTTGSVRYTTTGAGGGKKKLYESIKQLKDAKLESLPDEFFVQSETPYKDGIKEVTYKNRKTGKTKIFYKPRVGPNKATIPGKGAETKKEAQTFVDNYFKENPKQVRVRDPEKNYITKDKRKKVLEETDKTKATGTKKFNYHHVRQIAGGVPLTTDDVMIIDQKINSKLGGKVNESLNRISAAIQKNNRLALEAMNAKDEGAALDYMKRSDELNAQAEKIVNSAIDDLPEKYKGSVGFNQFTLPRNEYGFPISNEPMIIKKVGGMPVSKDAIDLTTLDLKQEKEFRKIVKAQAEAGKTGKINLEKITQDLGTLGCPKGLPAASGGRIKFDKGGACVLKGKRVLAQGLKTGFKEGSEAILATAILKGGKSLKDIAKLKNLVGPAALAFLAAEEAGYVGYDILSKGKSFKEAIGDSYFNSFLGTKTKYDKDGKPYQVKVDPIKERNKRMIEEGMTKEQMGKIAAYEGALKEEDRILNVFDKLDTAEQGQLDEMSESSDFSYLPNRTKEFKKQEDEARADLRDIGKTGAIDKVLSVDAQGGVDALTEGLRRNELAQLQSVDNIFQSRKGDKNRAARKRELMLQNPDILNYMGPYPTTLGFARGGLSGGDTSGPPPESGPMSQGLRSLYKNGRKL